MAGLAGRALLAPAGKAVQGVEVVALEMGLGRAGQFFDAADAGAPVCQQFGSRKHGKHAGWRRACPGGHGRFRCRRGLLRLPEAKPGPDGGNGGEGMGRHVGQGPV